MMPGASDYQGPRDALEKYQAVVEASSGDAVVKGAKSAYTSRNGHMFSFLDSEGSMAIRLPDVLVEEFRSTYDSGPVIQYESVMRGYTSVPAELLANAQELVVWFDRSCEWIGTLAAKPTKRKRA
jgi:hypothetical protein